MNEAPAGRVLVVCTANQCRSPLAAASFRARADRRGLELSVDSAGIATMPGNRATPPTIDAAAALGLDLSTHQSRALTQDMIRNADLVLGMERRHVQEVVLADPGSFPRTFTLKEFVRRGEAAGPRRSDEPLDVWLVRVHQGRRSIDLLGVSSDDDVADPTGSRLADHRSTAAEVDELVSVVLDLGWPA